MLVGRHVTATEVTIGGRITTTVAMPAFVESWVDVAMMVAVPALVGVNTPETLIVPTLVGLTDQVTEELKLPVPATVGVQVEVCVVRMDAGEHVTDTELTVTGIVTATVADPDLVESCVEVAVMVAVPAPAGVNTPAALIVPILVGLTDHVTAEL
jgi:hypothetical protein